MAKYGTVHKRAVDANGSPLRYAYCGIPLVMLIEAGDTATFGSLTGSNVCEACVHVLRAERLERSQWPV